MQVMVCVIVRLSSRGIRLKRERGDDDDTRGKKAHAKGEVGVDATTYVVGFKRGEWRGGCVCRGSVRVCENGTTFLC